MAPGEAHSGCATYQIAALASGIERLGPALVDVGSPFGARTAVADDGGSGVPGDVNGYSIVEADSMESARALTQDHPFLTEGKGRFSVEVIELSPM